MKSNKIKQVVSDALMHRGFSKSEATKLIVLLAETTKEQEPVSVNKHIDIYV